MLEFLQKILPDPNERKLKGMEPTVDHINMLESDMEKLSDQELRAKTDEFKNILAERPRDSEEKKDRELEKETLEFLLPEAFAVVRETARRRLGMRHYDVQMVGGMVLHNGQIAEMRTGEGKTLVATLPAYLNALTGKGVHVVTVNDYLAQRDAEWMGEVYRALGLDVGLVLSQQRGMDAFAQKKAAYAADITYGTNNEFGFDFLRDNMAAAKGQLVQRPYNYAIIDEVDSILIDEARTPLIISGRLQQSAELYRTMARVAPLMKKDDDYTVDEKARNVILTEEGIDRAQEILGVEDLFDIKANLAHHLLQALKAKELFRRDTDYVVKDGDVVIVDEFTGRLMEGRRWSDGLHQAVEAKENVNIQDETQTLASITFQNLFRLYPKLAGMTGTAKTEEPEFEKIYKLNVTVIPTNRPDIRNDHSDTIYKTEAIKYFNVIEEIVRMHDAGRPTLVGTVSIEKSEKISQMLTYPKEMTDYLRQRGAKLLQYVQGLKETELESRLKPYLTHPETKSREDFTRLADDLRAGNGKGGNQELADSIRDMGETVQAIEAIKRGIPHHVLNAKHHEKEAVIVAQAGRKGAVTIATNMAGRGTDILLGGNPEFLARQELEERGKDWRTVPDEEMAALAAEKKKITDAEKSDVIEAGGLHIIGTERHESRRIDNQLRGRAARQGDPGSTHFFLSLQDSLMRIFGGDRVAGMMDLLGVDEAMPISHKMVSGAIEGAQRKVEAHNFEIRKSILQYDDVLTEQRHLIYDQRRKVLAGESLRDSVVHMIDRTMERLVDGHLMPGTTSEDWEERVTHELVTELHGLSTRFDHITTASLEGLKYQQVLDLFKKEAQTLYLGIENELNRSAEELEKTHGILLTSVEDAEEEAAIKDLSPEKQAEARHPLRRVERDILLSVIDNHWVNYLHSLDSLREGIGLRAYGQKDPLNEYKSEAFAMFQNLTYQIQRDTVMLLFNSKIQIAAHPNAMAQPAEEHSTVLTDALEGAEEVHQDANAIASPKTGNPNQ